MIRSLAAAAALLSTAALAHPLAAQVPAGNSAPQPVPFVDTIPAPRDTPFPGTIRLAVDATDTQRGILRVKETIPVPEAGHMVLLFPKWLPGAHSPRGEIEKLAGLVVTANGKRLDWTRDPVDVFAFHIDVPAGAKAIEANFQFLSATKSDQGRIAVTPTMISLQPNSVSLYPAGYFTRQIPIQMTVTWPQGWTAAGAIPAKVAGATSTYDTTNYEILVDSPILAGKYGKVWPLTDRVNLNVFADTPDELAATPEQIAAHRRLVEQAVKTFGAQHYDRYEFLLSITDRLGGIGLEHHRSSENGVTPGYFTKWNDGPGRRNLLPHEFTHSWDGKFRRGADLWTPDFRTPMRDSLLWVYEGQTQFWGYVLQARSGLVSKQDTLDQLAAIAATYDSQPARAWRDLIDTTNDPVISARRPKGWTSWQRSEDYYNEGLLVWLDVDSLLREKSGGTKSIDDFARAFFGVRDGDWGELTYTFDDVAATLNAIVPWDWAVFLKQRLTEHAKGAPLDGFTRNGYRLVYTDTPTPSSKAAEAAAKNTNLTWSGGLIANATGELTSVTWDSPAFAAGMTVADQIVAIDGDAWSADRLKAAITAAKGTKEPIQLTVKRGDSYRSVALDYHGGLRYPRLEKTGTGDSGLDRLLAAR
ncbi:peptidase M61 [Sphingomonas ginsenosidimutans]|jgi:predicted metalloprotease with PDZ domain|uniref:Peptidase M61 n=1 Tax=Sphingomonas ginsenosidimutans TaxID=862134 RepID=A0A2A4HX39_9SPHN|nr:M61 family metallopeptidase [Sphingomonas ginsenosidimutans]PCG08924.1 peptidase M61 [Sphingomonas ginsenosidimutans]